MRVKLVINKNYIDMRSQRNIRKQYSDLATGWRIRGSKPGSHLLRNVQTGFEATLSLLFNGYRGSYPGVKRSRRKMTTCLHLAPRLRMSGAIPLFPLYALRVRGGTTVPFNDSEMTEGQVTCHTERAHRRIYGTITMCFSEMLFDCQL